MRILLDTHIWLWALTDSEAIPPRCVIGFALGATPS
jgi:PIN domain nuclease of toxin-antitoxin system